MGSGTKRRQGDNVRIVPQKPKSPTGTHGGSSGGGSQEIQDRVCPASFKVDLNRQILLGSRVTLEQEKDGEVLLIRAGSHEVGQLSRMMSKRISNCISSGYQYEGVVKEESGHQYAEFTQK